MESTTTAAKPKGFGELDQHRRELTAHCYRMLGSPFEAEDAVQETLLRAWRSLERFEGRASVRSWLYKIATNTCLDMLDAKQRRARPMELGDARSPDGPVGDILPEVTWVEPVPDALVTSDSSDPAAVAESRESIRLAFIAALQHLPPRQRAALILCEVLHWKAAEVAELLQTSTPAINSALQRARATLDAAETHDPAHGALSESDSDLLARYVDAFQRYDIDALTSLIHEDATQSMPPYELWLRGRDDIFAWWVGKGAGCRGSRVLATQTANGSPAFAQYKPREDGSEGYEPWALQVLEIADGKIVEMTFFLSTETIFPLFGLPLDYAELAAAG
ncbi:MAG TPA: sigma-70 family RNA polymerase sigma factor [Solirubrobacteraceae bacterium]